MLCKQYKRARVLSYMYLHYVYSILKSVLLLRRGQINAAQSHKKRRRLGTYT
jgi:hypothetical protein